MSEGPRVGLPTRRRAALAVLGIVCLMLPGAAAQELEPRLFSNTPIGLHFLAVAGVHSSGNVLFDPTIPVEGARAELNQVLLRYVHSFPLWGRSSKFDLLLPWATGQWSGLLEGEPASTTRTGLGDPRLRWSLNVVGSPATPLEEFQRYQQQTIFGVALQVIVPLGQYDPELLINLGSNRFTFIPEIGVSHTVGHWTIEAGAEVWLFTDNTDFFGGSTLTQDPVFAAQLHGVYEFRPGLWLSFGAAIADGGESRVDGEVNNRLQSNSRAGLTFAFPIDRKNGLSVTYSRGVTTRIGANFENIGVAYQHMFGGRRRNRRPTPGG